MKRCYMILLILAVIFVSYANAATAQIKCNFVFPKDTAQIGKPFSFSYSLSGGSGSYTGISIDADFVTVHDYTGNNVDDQRIELGSASSGTVTFTPVAGTAIIFWLRGYDAVTQEYFYFECHQGWVPIEPNSVVSVSFQYLQNEATVGQQLSLNYNIESNFELSEIKTWWQVGGERISAEHCEEQNLNTSSGFLSFTPSHGDYLYAVITGKTTKGDPFYAESDHLPINSGSEKITCVCTFPENDPQIGKPYTFSYVLAGGSGSFSDINVEAEFVTVHESTGKDVDNQIIELGNASSGTVTFTPKAGSAIILWLRGKDAITQQSFCFECHQGWLHVLPSSNYSVTFTYKKNKYSIGDNIRVDYIIGNIQNGNFNGNLWWAVISDFSFNDHLNPLVLSETSGSAEIIPSYGTCIYAVLEGKDSSGKPIYAESEHIYLNNSTINLSSAIVTSTNRIYTGSNLTSIITVTLDGIVLAKETDYQVSYINNVNVGTATAIITGIGQYSGTISKSFRILPRDLSNAIVSAANKAYTGNPRTTTVSVELNGKTLVQGTDYTVAYANNIVIGTATAAITGTGNYKGTASTTFKIVTRDLSGAAVTAGNRTYTGSTVASTITVKIDGRTLVKGTDYNVKYANNVNVGTATATITGIGNYKGTVTKTFNILPKDLSGATVTVQGRTYTGKALEPPVTVELGGKILVKDTDYSVSYKNNVNVGAATVTVTGIGNYTGMVSKTFRVVAKDLSGATLTAANKAYTGSPRETTVAMVLGGVTLTQGTDFTVAYTDNVEVGTATATITGTGNYKGTGSITFKIVTRDLSGAAVTASNRTYTGSAVGSTITVKLDGRTLVKGTDYKVSYRDNVNVGTATVTITGIGNYKGSTSKTFKILPIDLSGATVTCSNRNYTGTARTSAPTVVLNGKTLAEGTDYTVSYSNNVNAGTAKVIVTGKGNYTGTAAGTFKINKLNLNNAEITASNRKYTGKPVKSSLKVVMNGATLVEGTDYTTQYSNNVEVGTATVTITGIGNYTGTVVRNYQIKP